MQIVCNLLAQIYPKVDKKDQFTLVNMNLTFPNRFK